MRDYVAACFSEATTSRKNPEEPVMRILIAEHDPAVASLVKKGLEAEHYAVDVAADEHQAYDLGAKVDYDLAVLDLDLPGRGGISMLRYLRTRRPTLPMLVLTQGHRLDERVQCFDLGADDCVEKPIAYTELSARIRVLMRRCHFPLKSVLTVDDLELDRVEHRVQRAGKRIELTSKEFGLLEYLMRNMGRRVTRPMIIEHVWNLSFDCQTNVVDVYVNYLRRKIDVGFVRPLIHTIRGVGYELSSRGEYLRPKERDKRQENGTRMRL